MYRHHNISTSVLHGQDLHPAKYVIRLCYMVRTCILRSMLYEYVKLSGLASCEVCYASMLHCQDLLPAKYVIRVCYIVRTCIPRRMVYECVTLSGLASREVCYTRMLPCHYLHPAKYGIRVCYIVRTCILRCQEEIYRPTETKWSPKRNVFWLIIFLN